MALEYNFTFEVGDKFRASKRAGKGNYDKLNLIDVFVVDKIHDKKWADGNTIYDCHNSNTGDMLVTRTEYMIKLIDYILFNNLETNSDGSIVEWLS